MDEQWNIKGLEEALEAELGSDIPVQELLDEDHSLDEEAMRAKLHQILEDDYAKMEASVDSEVIRHFEKSVMLQVLDNSWKEHLAAMDYLRQGIHLRGYAHKNPKQEYKREAFSMFTELLENIKHEVIGILSKVQVRAEEDVTAVDQERQTKSQNIHYEHAESNAWGESEEEQPENQKKPAPQKKPFIRSGKKIGRNEPCTCGSGKKYKQCHGRLA